MSDLYLFACCVASLYILSKASNLFNFFNPAVYFYWIMLFFNSIGYFYRDLYDYAITISNEAVGLIGMGLLAYSFGVILASNNKKKSMVRKDVHAIISDGAKHIKIDKLLLVIACIIPIMIALLFTLQQGEILWLMEEFDDRRIEVRKGSGWIAILGIASADIATIYLSIYAYNKRKFAALFPAIIVLVACGISYGNREPAIDILVVYGTFFWIRKYKKINAIDFIVAVMLLFSLVITLGIFRQGLDLDFDMLSRQLLWRPFANVQNLEWMLEFVPKTMNYFYGEVSVIELSVLLPGYQPNFGTYMKDMMGAEFSGGSITFGIIGMLYADFGPIVAILLIGLIGFLLQRIFFHYQGKPSKMIVLILLSIGLKGIAISGIITPIIYSLIPCLIIYYSLEQIIKRNDR